jgi:hypothetical protein
MENLCLAAINDEEELSWTILCISPRISPHTMKDSIVVVHLMMFMTERAGIDTGKMKQLARLSHEW